MENLRVRLLGELQVEGCDPAALGRRQSRTLLKILAMVGRADEALATLAVMSDQLALVGAARGRPGRGRGPW